MPLYEFDGKRPTLGNGVYIAPNATVIGDVTLGDEASVWFGAVIRGDHMPIRLGARTNLQDGSVVHITAGKASTTVGDDVTVGHMALLHGCTVGDRVLVGMGSILLDGSIVEDDAIIAAGSLLAPGTRIASGSLAMGRPAKVVRRVSDEERRWVLEASRSYVETARTFASERVKRID